MTEPFLDGGLDLGAPSLEAALEAVLLVAEGALATVELATALGVPEPEVTTALHHLAADYSARGSGIEVREVAEGWRLYTAADCQAEVERFVRDGQNARLTHAALETLAIVAYRQPISRGRIAAIRGVNVDSVVRTLVTRGLIEGAGEEMEGQATLFRTTSYFLERMGLMSLQDLPEIADLVPAMDSLDHVDLSL